jgi:hypothetical protein
VHPLGRLTSAPLTKTEGPGIGSPGPQTNERQSLVTNSTHNVYAQVDREFAEAWRPEPGDKLVGEVVELSQRDGSFGVYPIITIRRDDGTELALHAFHSVAQNELARARPQVGETIAVKYVGKKTGADGRSSYHAYKVAVDRPAAAFNWGAFSDIAPVEPDIPTDLDEPEADDDRVPF